MKKLGRVAHLFVVFAFVTAGLSATVGLAQAQSRFEGRWSVLIITDRGECDRAYRYSVQIIRGAVVYGGEAGITMTGRVDRRGRLRVTLSRGSALAQGTGRLSGNYGAGVWSGRSGSAQCGGRWEAERRGR